MKRVQLASQAILISLAFSCSAEKGVTIHNTPPAVTITAPIDGREFDAGDRVEFQAVVEDSEDAAEDLTIVWSSEVDGTLDEESHADTAGKVEFVTSSLSSGSHTIVLTVVDTGGQSGQSSTNVFIVDVSQGPQVDIRHPVDGDAGAEDTPYTFEASVSDPQDFSSALVLRVMTDAGEDVCEALADDGGIADCDAVLAVGTHTLVFEVQDTDGNTDDETTEFEVIDGDLIDDDEDGFSESEGDCDDTDDDVSPDVPEIPNEIDDDCDGDVDEGTIGGDDDGDGFTELQGDCDDAEPAAYPGAFEVDDGVDNDCDGLIDEGTTNYDDDGDCFCEVAPCAGSDSLDCSALQGGDCDDTDDAIHPDALETCDEIDNDCDGDVDSDDEDTDGDGDGWTVCEDDCDDDVAAVNPDAEEVCDGIDNNCDGLIDDTSIIDGDTYYPDLDADGYGDMFSPTTACALPSGYVTDATDCDDTDAYVHPGAPETCDEIDNDCDGDIDSDDEDTDYDEDGWTICEGDCDDDVVAINPDADEVCDGIDNNCDDLIDDTSTIDGDTYYRDLDGDDYGDWYTTISACSLPFGYVTDSTDCDDTDADAYPGATERCDGADNDCNGFIDEEGADDCVDWHRDYDDDSYGTELSACLCSPDGHYTVTSTNDCYDYNSSANPSHTSWHTTDRGDSSYDYNCDDVEEKQDTSIAGDCGFFDDGLGCGVSDGWSGSAPSCGSGGTWNSGCYYSTSGMPWDWGCYWGSSVASTQSCR